MCRESRYRRSLTANPMTMISRKDAIVQVSYSCCMVFVMVASHNTAMAFVPSPPPQACSSLARRGPNHQNSASHTHLRMKSAVVLDDLALYQHSPPSIDVDSLDFDSSLVPHSPVSSTLMLSDGSGGGGDFLSSATSVVGAGFLIAAAIFLYANVVYTPEIMQNAQAMREEEQTAQILALVRQLEAERGRDGMADTRDALEKVFGTSIEDYVEQIEERIRSKDRNDTSESIAVSNTEKELVETLKSVYMYS